MQKLSKPILLKLLIPIGYGVLACIYFTYSAAHEQITTHHVIGMLTTVIAFVFWITARIQLGNSFTLAPEAKKLVQSGIYSKLRHPVYYFSLLAVAGIVIFAWSNYMFIALGILLIVELVRIKQEEKILLQKFGNDYVEYKRSTWF